MNARGIAVLFWAAFAGAPAAAEIAVTNTNDSVTGSLRQAIQDAAPGDTIVFQIPTTSPGFDPATGIYTVGLTSGQLVINKDLTIDSRGQKVRVQRNSQSPFRIFNVTTGQVTIRGLTIRNGDANPEFAGGGIANAGNLTVKNCTLADNVGALAGYGGAISNSATATLRISNCTLTGNRTGTAGSAIINFGQMTIENSTITGNRNMFSGDVSAVYSNGGGTTARVRNTIIVGNLTNATPRDVVGTYISEGHNLIGSTAGSTGFGATGDQLGVTVAQANLGPLQDNGGPTQTMRPRPGSFAIDQGNRGLDANGQPINTDQRGQPRPIDLPGIPNAIGGDGSDIGAVETGPAQGGPAFTVTTGTPHATADEGCTTDDCTLVEAIAAANASQDANTILFAAGIGPIIGSTAPGGITITGPVTISGPGARQLSIDAQGSGRIFNVSASDVTIAGLTLTRGYNLAADGGAIYNAGQNTAVRDCTFSANTAFGSGGAVYNNAGSGLTLLRCTFDSNAAPMLGGGAIFNAGTLTAINCTFYHNSATHGGAIQSVSNNGTSLVTLRNCTITDNTATSAQNPSDGGGGYHGEAVSGEPLHHFSNTILAGNNNGVNPDLSGYATSEGNNLVGNLGQGGSGFSHGVNGDLVGLNPLFGSFGNNGGQTDTVRLLSNSPAINTGNSKLAPLADQRGYQRRGAFDIGACEFGGIVPPPVSLSSAVSRKAHGATGDFDISLPGVECRGAGITANHKLVLTFAAPLTNVGSAMITSGAASISNAQTGPDPAEYIVDLTAVANAQSLTLTLRQITDATGNTSDSVSTTVGFLIGDTNADGITNSGDVLQTRNRSGAPVEATTFRSDVNADGTINAADALQVRTGAGTTLP